MPMIKKVFVFDLDGTTIDSFHRVKPCLLPNGDLDLQMYIDSACTEEKINKDTLLPLANYMQQLIARGERVVIMTARHCNNADYAYIRKYIGRVCVHLSRDRLASVFGKEEAARITKLGDAAYKKVWFEHLFQTMPNCDFQFFDDHKGILEMANKLNVQAVDATIMNQLLSMQYADMYSQGFNDSESLYESLIDECSQDDVIINPLPDGTAFS